MAFIFLLSFLALLFFVIMAIIPPLRRKISPNFTLKQSLLFGLIGFIIMLVSAAGMDSSEDKARTMPANNKAVAEAEPETKDEPMKEPVTEDAVKEVTPSPEPADNETASQRNAVRTAKNYLSFTAFSRKGLIEQLEFEGYSNADAEYAVDQSGEDWNEQAVKAAKNYLEFTAFSRKGLIEQLEFEGYSTDSAEYAVDRSGADWNEQAAKAASNYLDFLSFSEQSLKEQLQFEGYTSEQAEYGVKKAYR